MLKIAHISDVHLRPLPEPTLLQLASKRIVGFINWKLNRKSSMAGNHFDHLISHMISQAPDQILVTGDLTNISLPAEYEAAARFLEGLGEPEKVLAIGGNHDAYVPGAFKKAIRRWSPFMSGDGAPLTGTSGYPVVRVREDVALIACNSAEATLPFFATGYFQKKQADRLRELLEAHKDKCRVVMIHHPPVQGATPHHKRLVGTDRFQAVIAQSGAELVLHGHTHLATRNWIPGPGSNVPVICVPAAGQAQDHNGKPAGRYNLLSIEKRNKNWSIEMEEYGKKGPDGTIGLIATHTLS